MCQAPTCCLCGVCGVQANQHRLCSSCAGLYRPSLTPNPNAGAHFVELCAQRGVPLLFLQNIMVRDHVASITCLGHCEAEVRDCPYCYAPECYMTRAYHMALFVKFKPELPLYSPYSLSTDLLSADNTCLIGAYCRSAN